MPGHGIVDNTVIPLEDSFADDIETQLFPAFGLNNTDWRIVWDRSQVPALREDEQAKHSMIAADFKAGVIDRDETRVALGYESKPEYRGQFVVVAKGAASRDEEADETKAIRDWFRKKTTENPHNTAGSFAKFRFSDGHGNATLQKVEESLAKATHLTESQKKNYRAHVHEVMKNMPPGARKRLDETVRDFKWYKTQKSLSDEICAESGTKKPQYPYRAAYFQGTLYLDGGESREQMLSDYAHEFAHALHGPSVEMANSSEWKNVWELELRNRSRSPFEFQVSPSEAWAKLGEWHFSGKLPDSRFKKLFSLSYDYWKQHDFIQSEGDHE